MMRRGRPFPLLRFLPTRIYRPGMHKTSRKRLDWDKIEAHRQREGREMVKGRNKRVVIVKSPDPRVFEQAIFILREDFSPGRGGADIVREAEKVADHYLKGALYAPKRLLLKLRPLLIGAGSALLALLLWLVFRLFWN